MVSNKNSQAVCNHIKKRKLDLISVLGGKCCICGFNNYPEALEFHHVHPEEKEFGLTASNAITRALDKQLIELRKCILVCANCHRGIHAGYIDSPNDPTIFFNEEIANNLIKENQEIRFGKRVKCQRCGKEIKPPANYCKSCYELISRKTDRPTRDELKLMIRTMPFTHIAQQYLVTDNAVRRWCNSYNLPSKKKDIKSYSDEEWTKI